MSHFRLSLKRREQILVDSLVQLSLWLAARQNIDDWFNDRLSCKDKHKLIGKKPVKLARFLDICPIQIYIYSYMHSRQIAYRYFKFWFLDLTVPMIWFIQETGHLSRCLGCLTDHAFYCKHRTIYPNELPEITWSIPITVLGTNLCLIFSNLFAYYIRCLFHSRDWSSILTLSHHKPVVSTPSGYGLVFSYLWFSACYKDRNTASFDS